MTRIISFAVFLFATLAATAQPGIRPLHELVNTVDPGWPLVKQWIDSAKNKVKILPVDSGNAKAALVKTQVTTRSPMGAILYCTSGILVDDGWIRILGSGGKQMKRSLPGWNKGKTLSKDGEPPLIYLIADDAVGGFFALNGGKLGADTAMVYYLSPDHLQWEPLEISYTDFLHFCFNGDLDSFYGSMRWQNWRVEVAALAPDKMFSFMPYLWSKEGKDINKNVRDIVPAEEQYQFNLSARKQLGLDIP